MLTTERLILRPWRDADREPFAAMGADPAVMRYFPGLLSRAESDAVVDRLMTALDTSGMTFWAVEVPGEADFIGFVGTIPVSFEAAFTPAVEIGWRLATAYHGRGFASEAAREALRFGFEEHGLDRIVSFTATQNQPSQAVMARIGMRRRPELDFDHPRLEEGHPLRRHVLYELTRDDWAAQTR